MNHIYIFMTILFTVYGQIVIKWQVNSVGAMPTESTEKIWFLMRVLLNPWIIGGFLATFLAAISWMAAMSKFPISYAYPYYESSFCIGTNSE